MFLSLTFELLRNHTGVVLKQVTCDTKTQLCQLRGPEQNSGNKTQGTKLREQDSGNKTQGTKLREQDEDKGPFWKHEKD